MQNFANNNFLNNSNIPNKEAQIRGENALNNNA